MKEEKSLNSHWRWLTSNSDSLDMYHECDEEEHSDALAQGIRRSCPQLRWIRATGRHNPAVSGVLRPSLTCSSDSSYSSDMYHGSRGFTLLEVLLAVFIGAIVLTVLYA